MKYLFSYIRLSSLLLILPIFGCSDYVNETYKIKPITSDKVNEMIFIKTKNWGLTGDNQITFISPDSNFDFNKKDSNDHYIFIGLEPFFYKQSNDSLILYLRTKVNVPKNFKTKYFAPKGTDSVAIAVFGAKVVKQ